MGKLVLLALFLPLLAAAADFSGTWTLKSERPETGTLPEPPPAAMTIEQNGSSVLCEAGESHWSFRTDGKESRAGDRSKSLNTVAKYEGSALLINTIVNGARGGYTQMDRWQVSATEPPLRSTVKSSGAWATPRPRSCTRSRDAAPWKSRAQRNAPSNTPSRPAPRIPLVLLNSVSTKQSSEGDRVYLQTAFPIVAQGRIVIPPGSYVTGTLTFVKRPGRVMGRGELYLRFDSVTLPNGVTRDFRSRVGALDGQAEGHLDRREGNIKSEGNRSGDARNVAETTAAGASVGAIAGAAAGRPGLGTGIGAAAGAAAGLMGVLLTRGPDTVLGRGSTLEMVLDRTLIFTATEIGASPGAPTH